MNNGSREIPALGFGTSLTDRKQTRNAVKTAVAVEVGFGHLDTAERHPNEAQVGTALTSMSSPSGHDQTADDSLTQVTVYPYAMRPGPTMDLTPLKLRIDLADMDPDDAPLEAYERLLLDVMRGDQRLFTRSDEVDRLWQICQPVLDAPLVRSVALYPQEGDRP